MLIHNVYFALKESTPQNRQKLLDACHKYLRDHRGIILFACGVLADALKRDVNDRDFDVGLHIVFDSQETHDAYQTAPRHEEFIAENKANWKKGRVFDSVA